MINTLKLSLKIDFNYAINSFIYSIQKVPILKNIITNSLYEKSIFKAFVRILGVICTTLKLIVFRCLYFMVIYYLSKWINQDISATFIHIFLIFSMMGMFINTSILSTSRKKYISILLLKMNAKKFILSHYYFNLFTSFLLNLIFLSVFHFTLEFPISIGIILSLFGLFSKNIGETVSIWYYKKNNRKLLTQKLYFFMIILGFGLCSLSFFHLYFNFYTILLITCLTGFLTIPCLYYLHHVKNYQTIYKRLNAMNHSLDSIQNNQLIIKDIVEIHEKDQKIDSKKLQNKKGYELFNTIFFERHKSILMRSSKIFTIVISFLVVVAMILIFTYPNYHTVFHKNIIDHFGFLVFILYFINRGAIVTQAMFFNCDCAMLTFNFYKDKKGMLSLFKKRVKTLIKVNLMPAFTVAIGCILILITTGRISLLESVSIVVFVMTISILFSVHYLVIYYLFQPYSKEMKMKSPTYSFVSFLTYFFCYFLSNIHLGIPLFSLGIVLFTVLYILVAFKIVYRYAPYTFKIK